MSRKRSFVVISTKVILDQISEDLPSKDDLIHSSQLELPYQGCFALTGRCPRLDQATKIIANANVIYTPVSFIPSPVSFISEVIPSSYAQIKVATC